VLAPVGVVLVSAARARIARMPPPTRITGLLAVVGTIAFPEGRDEGAGTGTGTGLGGVTGANGRSDFGVSVGIGSGVFGVSIFGAGAGGGGGRDGVDVDVEVDVEVDEEAESDDSVLEPPCGSDFGGVATRAETTDSGLGAGVSFFPGFPALTKPTSAKAVTPKPRTAPTLLFISSFSTAPFAEADFFWVPTGADFTFVPGR
jgi:hypothetical protein